MERVKRGVVASVSGKTPSVKCQETLIKEDWFLTLLYGWRDLTLLGTGRKNQGSEGELLPQYSKI